MAFAWLAACAASASEQPPGVLFLASHDIFLPANLEGISGFRSVFEQAGTGVRLYVEYLDLVRFPEAAHDALLAAYLGEKYRGVDLDAVVAGGRQALDFVNRRRGRAWPGVPVVFLGVPDGAPELGALDDRTVGVLLPYPLVATAELALRLQPETRHLFAVSGAAQVDDRDLEALARRELRALADRVTVHFVSGSTLEAALDRVARLPERSAILFLSFLADAEGRRYHSTEVVEQIGRTAEAPVYGLFSTLLGRGVVGGSVVDFDEHGRAAGRLAARLVDGESPAALGKPLPTEPVVRVDDRELRRWGIGRERLPEDAEVLFPVVTPWERYGGWLTVLALLFAAQTALVAALVGRGRRLRAAGRESQRLQRELAHAWRVGTMGAFAGALSHELNQPLAAIMSNAQAARRFLHADHPDLGEVREILGDILDDDRRAGEVIRRLRAFMTRGELERIALDLNRVVADVIALVRTEASLRGVTIELALEPEPLRVSGDRVQLQQVVLNLVQNACDAAADSEDRRVTVATRLDRGRVSLAVRDRGAGLSKEALRRAFEPFFSTKSNGMGLGLSICRAIVEAHGGAVSASNEAEGGALLGFALPPAE